MSALTLTLILIALGTLVAGQILLKWALSDENQEEEVRPSMSSARRAWIIVGGIFFHGRSPFSSTSACCSATI